MADTFGRGHCMVYMDLEVYARFKAYLAQKSKQERRQVPAWEVAEPALLEYMERYPLGEKED